MVEPDITFIVTYRCPRCHAGLEARTSEAHTWLRCPKCGRASLPPEHMRSAPRASAAPGEDVLVIGPDAVDARRNSSGPGASDGYSGGGRRIAMAVAILVSAFMLMVSFLDGNAANVGIFGVTTIVLLGVVAWMSRGRS